MKEKKTNIIISPNNNYVFWDVDLEGVVRDCTLNVQPGCIGIYVVNGQLKSVNTPGKWLINSKEEDKSGAILQLIGVNTEKTFDICCGVGMIPFKDFDMNYETNVGAFGECKIQMSNPWQLYSILGHSNVTIDEIDEYVKMKLNELMSSELAKTLANADYDSIMAKQSMIAENLKKAFAARLFDLGMDVNTFALGGINFNDEYKQKRQEFFEEENRRKREKEERRQREREQRNEVDNLTSILNATQNIDVNNVPPQPAPNNNNFGGVNQAIKYCPKCGVRLTADVRFCPSCGHKF